MKSEVVGKGYGTFWSPPSREAWIEMVMRGEHTEEIPSPPSRGAWIEISTVGMERRHSHVAPLAGGVD